MNKAIRHCPEEWGPANDRRLTCSCGHRDPGHMDAASPRPPAAPVAHTFGSVMHTALETIASMPIAKQDNILAANMRHVASMALACRPAAPSPAAGASPTHWLVYIPSQQRQEVFDSQDDSEYVDILTNCPDAQVTPLYATPTSDQADAARQARVPMDDAHLELMSRDHRRNFFGTEVLDYRSFARAVERHHGIDAALAAGGQP